MKNDEVFVLDSGFGTHEGESDTIYRNRKMYAELAIEALEKQLPKQTKLVKRADGIISFYPCPSCSTSEKYVPVYPKQKYCENCGQRLDWGEEE